MRSATAVGIAVVWVEFDWGTDIFGARHATRNYGCLYIAQGLGSILGGPLAALLHGATGGWNSVFGVAIGADLLTAALALALLKPLRRAYARAA